MIFFRKENTLHGAKKSVGNVKWLRAGYLLHLAQCNGMEQARTALFNEGVDRKYTPTAHQVYQIKSDAKAAQAQILLMLKLGKNDCEILLQTS